MSNEKKPGYLLCIGGDKLPSYMGIIISHYKDPYKLIRISWNVSQGVLNVAQLGDFFTFQPRIFRGVNVVLIL